MLELNDNRDGDLGVIAIKSKPAFSSSSSPLPSHETSRHKAIWKSPQRQEVDDRDLSAVVSRPCLSFLCAKRPFPGCVDTVFGRFTQRRSILFGHLCNTPASSTTSPFPGRQLWKTTETTTTLRPIWRIRKNLTRIGMPHSAAAESLLSRLSMYPRIGRKSMVFSGIPY